MKRGSALPVMMFVLAMVSALAVSGAFVARQVAENARVHERSAGLEPLAENALVDAIAAWDSVSRSAQAIGQSVPLGGVSGPDTRVDAWVTRVTDRIYWLVAEARALARPRLARRLGAVVRVTKGVPALVSERAWSELP